MGRPFIKITVGMDRNPDGPIAPMVKKGVSFIFNDRIGGDLTLCSRKAKRVIQSLLHKQMFSFLLCVIALWTIYLK
jgi:hypothetical protein